MSSPISRHFPIFYSPTSQILRLSLVFLLLLSLSVDSFSRGSPEPACEEDMRPRHGFATQGGRPPAEIVVDQSEVRQDHYLRVTLRSTKPFKGFLLRAEDAQEKRNEFGSWSAVGTWYIPYQNISETSPTSAKYLHCGGAPQSAVTHAGANSGAFVVSFQWRPPADLVGRVRIQATVVEDYRTYWTGILAPAVTVVAKKENPVQQIQFVNSDALFGIGQTTRKTTTTTTATRAKIIKQEKSTQNPTKKTTKQISTSTLRSSVQPTTESTIARTTTKRTTKVTTEKVTELPASSTIISSSVSFSPMPVTESSTVTTTARTTSQKIQLMTKEQSNTSDATVSF